MITAVAIRLDGCTYSLPPPRRHHDVIGYLADVEGKPTPIQGVQGFIDDERGFVDRLTAARIALDRGQIPRLRWPPQLYSEDLW